MLPNAENFAALAADGFNCIPVMREVMADLDTPLSVYKKLADAPFSYLLESVEGGEKWGRYSIIGLPAKTIFKVTGSEVCISSGELNKSWKSSDPLADVDAFIKQFKVPELEGLPRFYGGLVGYFGYDTVRYVEKKLAEHSLVDPVATPDILLTCSRELVVFDNLAGRLMLVCHADPAETNAYEAAVKRLDKLLLKLRSPLAMDTPPTTSALKPLELSYSLGKPDFIQAVDRIKEWILDGDVMQTVISQRMSVAYPQPPLDLYRALRFLNPSPYMYFLNLDDFFVVGSSPEILARVEDGEVCVRPIAGTRRRGRDAAEDLAMEQELLADPKEIAEHLMLIDLGRNDVGRIARIGTVDLIDKMIVERYSHVMHLVSNVKGQLNEGLSPLDVLRATLPAGTLSGAPKVRAMEIIDELEPVKRGIYGGAVGYLAWNGNMDTAIAIRTAIIKDKVLHVQAGAGIVADSIPKLEWKETLNKGSAVLRAVEMVRQGLV